MPTELPYAADAEVSLSYDELDVCAFELLLDHFWDSFPDCGLACGLYVLGSEETVWERSVSVSCYRTNEVQLCVGFGEESP